MAVPRLPGRLVMNNSPKKETPSSLQLLAVSYPTTISHPKNYTHWFKWFFKSAQKNFNLFSLLDFHNIMKIYSGFNLVLTFIFSLSRTQDISISNKRKIQKSFLALFSWTLFLFRHIVVGFKQTQNSLYDLKNHSEILRSFWYCAHTKR